MIKDKKKLAIFILALIPLMLLSMLPFVGGAKADAPYEVVPLSDDVVYFDLAAGSVYFNGDSYIGRYYKTTDGVTEEVVVRGTLDSSKQYYVYQSTPANKSITGLVDGEMRIPKYSEIYVTDQDGTVKRWNEFITNCKDPDLVENAWHVKAANFNNGERVSTNNRVIVRGLEGTADNISTLNIVFDNLWSNYSTTKYSSSTTGGQPACYPVAFDVQPNNDIHLYLKGDNRFTDLWSSVNDLTNIKGSGNNSFYVKIQDPNYIRACRGRNGKTPGRLLIDSIDPSDNASGTMALACKIDDIGNNAAMIGGDDKFEVVFNNTNTDNWTVEARNRDGTAVTGSATYAGYLNLYIGSGTIFAGAPVYQNSNWSSTKIISCIATRNISFITITGGVVTAVSNSTAAAIGGGGGFGTEGGVCAIDISGGDIYAYSNGVLSNNEFVPCTAIGSGSCVNKTSVPAIINISGGNIFAQSVGGVAIGGGGSSRINGGDAYIDISGGNITALSVEGRVAPKSTNKLVPAGVSIGGGEGGTNAESNGGNATITISDSPTIVAGSIGGGHKRSANGHNGFANIKIYGGDIRAQFIMESGTATGCSFYMSGGRIHDVNVSEGKQTNVPGVHGGTYTVYYANGVEMKNGAAVWIKDPDGTALISGGTIESCTALNGGAVYMTGGQFDMTGGSVRNNEAINGGGIYLTNGVVNILDGSISSNHATDNGGGICVVEGTITMYGGEIDSNTADNDGGGFFVSANEQPALIDIISGAITNNTADNGGGMAIVSDSDVDVNIVVGVNLPHPNLDDDRNFTGFEYPADYGRGHESHTNHITSSDFAALGITSLTHESCPVVSGNHAIGTEEGDGYGGGFYMSSPNAQLSFYCVVEHDNTAAQNSSDSMYMEGGVVQIVGDVDYDGTGRANGNISINSSILVEGGQVDVYGEMTNPHFTDDVTVNIKNPETDHYIDHRLQNEDEEDHYKVQYVENFSASPDDPPTGLYIARQYPSENSTGYEVQIMASIFTHPGYRIVGWCTVPNPTVLSPDSNIPGEIWYKIDEIYDLSTLTRDDGMGTHVVLPDGTVFDDESLLRIYAIWEKVEYIIEYDPNPPQGVTYTGSMDVQSIPVDDFTVRLNENQYSVFGRRFAGWSLTPDGTGTIYEDNQLITENFTEVNGEKITLYAQWEICHHPSEELLYSVSGDTIIETCSFCGHTATAKIVGTDCDFDGSEHPARIQYSDEWQGEKNFVISYELEASEWDARDDIDDGFTSASIPLHAGTYEAYVTIDSERAVCSYTINPIKWDTPTSPVIDLVPQGEGRGPNVVITSPVSDANCTISYSMVHGEGEPNIWQSGNNIFEDLEYGKLYYFYARVDADRDHTTSDYSASEAYIYQGGNVVVIEHSEGIVITSTITEDSYDFSVTVEDGYHFDNYSVEGPELTKINETGYNGGIELQRNDVDKVYSITNLDVSAYYKVVISITGAVRDCTISASITEGEIFERFSAGNTVPVSSDSAFTSRFEVNYYSDDDYENQAFTFSSSLPEGTTLILRENDSSYWYYNVTGSGVTEVALDDFLKMGESSSSESAELTSANFTYQLVVDFSDVEGRDVEENLVVTLSFEKKNSAAVDASSSVTAELKHVAEFDFINVNTNQNTATLDCDYQESSAYASIWERRNTALVLEVSDESLDSIPSDLTLAVRSDGRTAIYSLNENNQFIVPLGVVDSYSDVSLTLNSNVYSGTGLKFNATWYVSSSGAGKSPLNGDIVATTILEFNWQGNTVPSLRIDGTDRLYQVGDQSGITVDLTYEGLPSDSVIRVEVHQKRPDGTYHETGAYVNYPVSDISTDGSGTLEVNRNLSTTPGSYRVYVIVRDRNGATLIAVPYYYIVEAN